MGQATAPVHGARCKSTSKVTAVLEHGDTRFALGSDWAAQSNKPIMKEVSRSGLGVENSRSRVTRPTAALSGVRQE